MSITVSSGVGACDGRIRNAPGRYCKWVLARRLGRIVPGRVESWGVYQHTLAVLLILCHVLSLENVFHVDSMASCVCGEQENDV
jgi:hypothetical protein